MVQLHQLQPIYLRQTRHEKNACCDIKLKLVTSTKEVMDLSLQFVRHSVLDRGFAELCKKIG